MNTRNQKNNSLIIDFHAHILPKADHGSTSTECSEVQLNQAKDAEVSIIVATPHFYPYEDSLENFLLKRSRAVNEINGLSEQLGIKLVIGCELLACVGIEKMNGIQELCLGSGKTLLIEMPDEKSWSEELCSSVLELQNSNGFTVILAHVDRYNPKYINWLFDNGLKGQVNASSLCKISHRRQIMKWIEDGFVIALGSDIHGSDTGYNDFTSALRHLDNDCDSLMSKAVQFI